MTQGEQKAPTGIYVVGVGVLLVGLLSFCCSAFAIFGQSQDQEAQLRQNPFVDQRMVEAIIEAQDTVFVPIVIGAVISVLIALALLIFSAFTLARKPLAAHTPIVLFAAAGWTVVDTAIALWAQTVQMDAMKPVMEAAGGGPGAAEAMNAGMTFGMGFAVCLYGGWALVKLALFVGGGVYLRKDEIQAHFTGGPPGGYGGPPQGGYGGPPQGGYGAPPSSQGGFGGPQGGQGGFGGPQGGQGGYGGPPQGGPGGGFGGPGGQGGPGSQGGPGGGFGGPPGGQGGPPGGGFGGG